MAEVSQSFDDSDAKFPNVDKIKKLLGRPLRYFLSFNKLDIVYFNHSQLISMIYL